MILDTDQKMAAPRRMFRIGRYAFSLGVMRWECTDGMRGVCGYRTPIGAYIALRRWQRVKATPQ